jgi:type VI secretion system FHA domain protein
MRRGEDDSRLRSANGDDEPRLTLEAVSDEGALLVERRKSFGQSGGTIGRSPNSDWVLSDDFVSRQHARITYSNGRFLIEDTNSTGGVRLNDRRLFSGQPQAIAPGDRVFIKPYAIEVLAESVDPPPKETRAFIPDNPAPAARKPETPLEAMARDPLKTHLPVAPVPPARSLSHDLDQWEVEPLLDNLQDQSVVRVTATGIPAARSRDTSSGIHRPHVADPPTVQVDAAPRSGPVASQTDVSARATGLDRLLASAGLDPARVTPEVAQQIGEILQVVVDGLLDVLHARQQARDAFRIQGTMFRPRGNNPLKFSTDVQDALHNLFVKQGPGYLGPVDAFEDVFNDLRHHQLASVAAMKKAFHVVLETFQPSSLQKRFDEANKSGTNKGRLGLLQGTPNYWARYGEWMDSLLQDPNGSFRDLFGQVFSQAYEEELRRLRNELRPSESQRKK